MAIWSLIYGYSGVTIVVVFALILQTMHTKVFSFKNKVGMIISVLDKSSYVIYLSHTTCLKLCATLRDMYNLNVIVVAVLSVVFTVVLTVLLFRFVEKPINKQKENIVRVEK